MATFTWTNTAGGYWRNETNWTPDTHPGATDTAVVDLSGVYTITVADVPADIGNVILDDATATLALTSDTLAVTSAFTLDTGVVDLAGGVLSGGTFIDAGGIVDFAGGTLNAVTWDGLLDLSAANASATITGGLTVRTPDGGGPGLIDLTGQGATLTVADAETLNDLTIDLGNELATSVLALYGVTSDVDAANAVTFGTASVVDVTGQAWIAYSTLTAAGTIAIAAGADLTLSGPGDAPQGFTTDFVNTGLISIAAGGTLSLGDVALANLGQIANDGGLLQFTGTLDLGAGTFTVAQDSPLGAIEIDGVVQNGTVVDAGGALATPFLSLDDVTWQGPLNVAGSELVLSYTVDVESLDGLSPGTIAVTGTSELSFDTAGIMRNETLSVVDGLATVKATTLTLEATAAVTLDAGTIDMTAAGLTNQAAIGVDAGAFDLTLYSFSNTGDVQIGDESTLVAGVTAFDGGANPEYQGQFGNSGSIGVSGASAMTLDAASVLNSGTIGVQDASLLQIDTPQMVNAGALVIGADSTLEFAAAVQNAGSIAFTTGDGLLQLDAPDGFGASIEGWSAGDQVELAAGGSYSIDAASTASTLVIDDDGTAAVVLDVGAGYLPGQFSIAQTTPGGPGFVELAAPCFAQGTHLAVPGGAAAVETLAPGDWVTLAGGGGATVAWVGHRRVDCARHARPAEVWPVRVRAHAFGPGRPLRDVWLSPDHAVFVDGVLVPIRCLCHGTAIAQERVDAVTYWHVELERHDILLAEGLACESFLDTGNRAAFDNGGVVAHLHPDFAARLWDGDACAPLVLAGAALQRIRARLTQQEMHQRVVPLDGPRRVRDGRHVPAAIPSGVEIG